MPHLAIKRLEERRVLNADAAPVELLVVDAGAAAGDGQADTFQVEQHETGIRVSVNGQETHTTSLGAEIQIVGSADRDVLVADLLAGARVTFDGGAGDDTLRVVSGESVESVTYTLGSAGDATDGSRVEAASATGDATAEISLVGVESIDDAAQADRREVVLQGESTGVAVTGVGDRNVLAVDGAAVRTLAFASPDELLAIDSQSEDAATPREVELVSLADGFAADLEVNADAADRFLATGDADLGGGDLRVTTGSIEVSGRIASQQADFTFDADSTVKITEDGRIENRDGRVAIDSGESGTTELAGLIDVSSDHAVGGRVTLLGESVRLASGAEIDASGPTGGGAVFVGGGLAGADPQLRNARAVTMEAGAKIQADATNRGHGGRVVLWADHTTVAAGEITARGGRLAGDGGFVETSGLVNLQLGGRVDATAANGAAGTWLIDPTDIIINNGATTPSLGPTSAGGTDTFQDPLPTAPNAATIAAADIVDALEMGNNVVVTTASDGGGAGNLTVDANILADLTTDAMENDVSLTLIAVGDITVNGQIGLMAADAMDSLTVLLNAGGSVVVNNTIDAGGGEGGNVTIQAASLSQNAAISTAGAGTVTAVTTGAITMAGGAVTSTAGGLIDYRANSGDVALTQLNAGGGFLRVTATAGAITDALGTEDPNLIGDLATLTAPGGIGAAAGDGDIDTSLMRLEVGGTPAGVFIGETDGLRLLAPGVTTAADGVVSLVAAAGTLEIDGAINAAGVGSVTLGAVAGMVQIDTAVNAGTGDVAITGASVTQNANLDTAGAGTVSVAATAGGIAMTTAAVTTTAGGTINYQATMGDILLARLNATATGDIVVSAADGSILDNRPDELANLIGDGLTLTAGVAIGGPGEGDVDTNVDTLEINSGTGATFVEELTGPLSLGPVTGAGGDINVETAAGTLAVAGAITNTGAGQVALAANGGNANVNGPITTATGDIVITSDQDASVAAMLITTGGNIRVSADNVTIDADVESTGAGSVTLTATDGNLTIGATGSVMTDSGAIDLDATQTAAVNGDVMSQTGDVFVDAMTITQTNTGPIETGAAGVVALVATGAITAGGMIDSGSGNILLDAGAALTVSGGVDSDSGSVTLTGTSINQTGAIETGGAGKVLLQAETGNLVSMAAIDSGAGAVHLTAAVNVQLQGDVTTQSGDIKVTGQAVDQSGALTAGATPGNGDAGAITVSATAGMLDSTANITSDAGAITLSANGAVMLANAVASTTGNVSVAGFTVAQSGAVTTGGAGDVSLSAFAGDLDSTAAVGSDDGDIQLRAEQGDVTITSSVTATGNGAIQVAALMIGGMGGDVTVDPGATVTATGTGSVSLFASETATVNGDVDSGTGSVLVFADGVAQAGNITAAGNGVVNVEATAGAITMSGNAVTATDGGTIDYESSLNTDIALTTLDAGAGNLRVNANGGAITDASLAETPNLIGNLATLRAAGGIGAAGDDDIDTSITLLQVPVFPNNLFINETNGLRLIDFGVVSGPNGVVSLVADAGLLEIDIPINAPGAGEIILESTTGEVRIDRPIDAGTGDLTVRGDSVDQNADLDTNAGGTITVEADGAGIDMQPGAEATTAGGLITYDATNGDLALSQLNATGAGNLVVRAGGNITDATEDEAANLVGDALTLQAGNAIGGLERDDLNTDVNTLTLIGGTGPAFIEELTGDLDIASVNGGGGSIAIETQTGGINVNGLVTNINAGGVLLSAVAGNVAVGAMPAGEINTAAGAITLVSDMDVVVDAAVMSVDGDISAFADNIAINAAVESTGAGDIDLNATNALTINGTVSSGAGGIGLSTGAALQINQAITTESGDIVATGGSVTVAAPLLTGDAMGDNDPGAVTLVATAGDFTSDMNGTIDTEAGSVSIFASMNVALMGAVTTQRAGAIEITAQQQVMQDAALQTGADATETDGGNITVRAFDAGAMSLVSTEAITTDAGAVELLANGAADLQAAVTTGSGAIAVTASAVDLSGSLRTGAAAGTNDGGDVAVTAFDGNLTTAAAIALMPARGSITTESGAVTLTATQGDADLAGAVTTDRAAITVEALGVMLSGPLEAGAAMGDGDLGDISITAVTGNLSTLMPMVPMDPTAVSIRTDAGSVTLMATQGDATLGGEVTTGTGDITVMSRSVTQAAAFSTGEAAGADDNDGGDVAITAIAGDYVSGMDGTIDTERGSVAIFAAEDATLEGTITTQRAGSIQVTGENVMQMADLETGADPGSPDGAEIVLRATDGDLDSTADIRARGNGPVDLSATAAVGGDLTTAFTTLILAEGNGAVAFSASNAATLNANVDSGTGGIAAQAAAVTQGGAFQSAGDGGVFIQASTGDFQSMVGGTISTGNGDVTVFAGQNAQVGGAVTTLGNGDVSVTGQNVTQSAAVETGATINVPNQGDILLRATNGALSSTAEITSDGGAIFAAASGAASFTAMVQSTAGDIAALGGSVTQSGGIETSESGGISLQSTTTDIVSLAPIEASQGVDVDAARTFNLDADLTGNTVQVDVARNDTNSAALTAVEAQIAAGVFEPDKTALQSIIDQLDIADSANIFVRIVNPITNLPEDVQVSKLFFVSVSGRFTALDGSNPGPLLVNQGLGVIDAVVDPGIVAEFSLEVFWREPFAVDPPPLPEFPIMGVPEDVNVLAAPEAVVDPDLTAPLVEGQFARGVTSGQFTHRFASNPDGAASPVVRVPVRLSDFVITQFGLGFAGRDVTARNSAFAIETIVEIQVQPFDVGAQTPLPEALPQTELFIEALPPAAEPSAPVTFVSAPSPVSSTPGVTTAGEERYYELRIISFDRSGDLVETDAIQLTKRDAAAVAPFNPSKLAKLFQLLPGDRYRLYLIEEGSERMVLDFVIEEVGGESRPVELPEQLDTVPAAPPAAEPSAARPTETSLPVAAGDHDGDLDFRVKPARPVLSEPVASGGLLFGAAVLSQQARRRRARRADRRAARFGRAQLGVGGSAANREANDETLDTQSRSPLAPR
ncbi:MAG: hypothetical protein AAGJ46_03330 [Planctomycetota bacterium]